MHQILAAATSEVFMPAQHQLDGWRQGIQTFANLAGGLGLLAGIVWFVLLFRAPSRHRMALGLVASAGLAIWMPIVGMSWALVHLRSGWAVILAVIPALSTIALLAGIAWIARHWRVVDLACCGACGHRLTNTQTICPECGEARGTVWKGRQWTVLSWTVAAMVSTVAGSTAVGVLDVVELDWTAELLIDVRDTRGRDQSTIFAEAIVRTRLGDRNPGGGFGSLVRRIESADAAPVAPDGQLVAVIPIVPRGWEDDVKAWEAGLPTILAGQSEPFSLMSQSWARTVIARTTARTTGGEAEFDPEIGELATLITFDRPQFSVLLAVVAAGPIAALVVVGLLALVRRRAVRRMSERLAHPPEPRAAT
jgi:uncharacterized OB-fold protein